MKTQKGFNPWFSHEFSFGYVHHQLMILVVDCGKVARSGGYEDEEEMSGG
jgi:hypothetical protein